VKGAKGSTTRGANGSLVDSDLVAKWQPRQQKAGCADAAADHEDSEAVIGRRKERGKDGKGRRLTSVCPQPRAWTSSIFGPLWNTWTTRVEAPMRLPAKNTVFQADWRPGKHAYSVEERAGKGGGAAEGAGGGWEEVEREGAEMSEEPKGWECISAPGPE
jgi:hypothetical protein